MCLTVGFIHVDKMKLQNFDLCSLLQARAPCTLLNHYPDYACPAKEQDIPRIFEILVS